jgi:hypothetical protein
MFICSIHEWATVVELKASAATRAVRKEKCIVFEEAVEVDTDSMKRLDDL